MVGFDGVRHVRGCFLRPRRNLFRQATVAILAFCAPIFAVLYWLTIPTGTWPVVAIGQLAVTLMFVFAALGILRTGVFVDHTGITERRFFGSLAAFPIAEVENVVLHELYQNDALDTDPQLFVLGAEGRLLVRMRGQFYTREAMETVIEKLAVPAARFPEPITLRELNESRPELLYWFERRLVNRSS